MFGSTTFSQAPFSATGGIVFESSIQETVRISDPVNGNQIYPMQVVDSWEVFDSCSILLTRSGICLDNLAAFDEYTTILFVFVLESCEISEETSSAEIFLTNLVSEQASASSLWIGDSLWDPIQPLQNPFWVVVGDNQTPSWMPVIDAQSPNWQVVSDVQTVVWHHVDDTQTPNWQYISTSS